MWDEESGIEEAGEPPDLGWVVTWPAASHTSFLLQAGARERRLGGLVEVAHPDLDAIARVLGLVWRLTGEPLARALVRSYEPCLADLSGRAPPSVDSRQIDGIDSHLLELPDRDALEAIANSCWPECDDFIVAFGAAGGAALARAARAPRLRLALPGDCPAAAGKYQQHAEMLAVVVRRERGRDWRAELARAVRGG